MQWFWLMIAPFLIVAASLAVLFVWAGRTPKSAPAQNGFQKNDKDR